MYLGDPNQISERTTIIPILEPPDIEVKYKIQGEGVHPIPPETDLTIQEFTHALATLFESYSAKWFPVPTAFLAFVGRVSYRWVPAGADSVQPPSSHCITHQVWVPERLTLYPLTFQITWKLKSTQYTIPPPPSTTGELEPVELDFLPCEDEETNAILQDAPRKRARRKVRLARLHAALAKWRAAKLADRYYKRYGMDSGARDGTESVLSTDTEADELEDDSDKNIR